MQGLHLFLHQMCDNFQGPKLISQGLYLQGQQSVKLINMLYYENTKLLLLFKL